MELGDDVHKAHKSCSLVVIYVLLFSWFMHWGMFILSLLQSWWLPAFGHEDVSDGQFGHIFDVVLAGAQAAWLQGWGGNVKEIERVLHNYI